MNGKILSIIKFICVVYLIVLIPKLGIFNENDRNKHKNDSGTYVLYGIENMVQSSQRYDFLKSLNLAMISNKPSVIQDEESSAKVLMRHGFPIKKSLTLSDESLAEASSSKSISSYWLRGVDVVLLDIQDSGIGFDGVPQFLTYILDLSSYYNKRVIVFDRPNPLGGLIEGPGQIPWRHGLTVGELAMYINKHELQKPVDLMVVPMVRWRRNRIDGVSCVDRQTGSFLRPMSLINPIQIGRQGDLSYQTLVFNRDERLSPWEVRFLKRICWKLGLQCINESYFDEGQQQRFDGVKIRLKAEVGQFSSFNTLLTLVRFFSHRKNIHLTFPDIFYKYVGSSDVQKFFQDKISFDSLKNRTQVTLSKFSDKSKDCLLYKPFPRVVYPELVKA